ncbi:MAG: cysteine--tRNA ligase [Nanoarchaeota archaeon]
MPLKLYNTLIRKKEIFKALKKNHVGMYSCGLTVYDYGHIGNFRAFVASDILRRYLEYKNYKVKKVVNITDVDDKTIKRSVSENKSLEEFTKKYEKAFFEDEKKMNIKKASIYPKATKHIKEMVSLIERLLKKGFAYKSGDGIYFNIKKFKNYGMLSGVKLSELKAGASERIKKDEYDKENAKDFALWKFYDNEDGNVFWNTKLGKGRPGWHIECSVMSSKYLGESFDIHNGGVDLIFPHHENEIAQSEADSNKKFVNFWIHSEWMIVDGKKMSKSLGNCYNIRDLVQMGYNPPDLRYFYLTGNYRSQLNFTFDNLKNSQNSLERLKNIIKELKNDKKINKEYLKKFENAMDNDLDTVNALQVLWSLIRDDKAEGKIRTIKKIDSIFGLDLLKKEKIIIPNKIMKLVKERELVRKEKNWFLADSLREKIRKFGYKTDDTKDGTRVSKI